MASYPWEDTPEATPQGETATDQNYVTVILKGGKGYGAPSISIRGASIPDALAQVENHKKDLEKLVESVSGFAKGFSRLVDGDTPEQSSGNGGGQQGKPAQASQPPNGERKYCSHGEMQFKSGTAKISGKAYSGYFCPTPQGTPDQCTPLDKNGKPWGQR